MSTKENAENKKVVSKTGKDQKATSVKVNDSKKEKDSSAKTSKVEKSSSSKVRKEKKPLDRSTLTRLGLAFLIPFIVAIIGLSIGGFAPFGDKDVLSAGHFEKYRYLLNDLHDSVNNGSVNTSGYISAEGYDISDSLAFYLSDPTNLLTLAVHKDSMSGVINLLYALKIGLAGLFFSMFLSYRKKHELQGKGDAEAERSDIISAYLAKKKEKKAKKLEALEKAGKSTKNADLKLGGNDEPTSKLGVFVKEFDIINLALSCAYALSAYMIGSGLNVTWLGAVALFPLLMLAVDKLIREGKWLFYCLTLAASFFLSFYITIIVFIFVLVYFFLQDFRDTKHIVTATIYKLIADLMAIGMSVLVIIPSLKSNLLKKMLSLEFPLAEVKVKIFDVFKGMLAGLETDASKETDSVAIYAGIFAIMMIFLYASNGNINFNKKVKTIALTAVLYVATFHSTMNYLFNGFYFTRQVSTVFGFILIFMILSMAYTVFINIEHQRSMTIVVSFVLVMAIIFMALLKSSNYTTMSPFMKSFELAAAYFFILILYKNDNMTHTVFKTAMGLLMVVEVAASFDGNLGNAGKTSYTYDKTYVGRYEAAEDYIHNTVNADAKISVFVDGDNKSTPLTNMLAGYDYVITITHTGHVVDGLEFMESYKGIDIYKNNYVIKYGFFVNDNILKLVYDNEEIFTSSNYLTNNTMGGEDIYELITGEFDVARAYSVMANDTLKAENRYQVSFAPEKAGNLYSALNGNITHMGYTEKDEANYYYYSLIFKPLFHHETNAQFALFNKTAFNELFQNLVVAKLSSSDSTSLSLSLESKEDGYALLPITSETWSCENVIDYFTIGDSEFALVEVNSGANEFKLEKQNNIYLYIFMMLLCLAICVIFSRFLLFNGYEKAADSIAIRKLSSFSSNNRIYMITFAIMSTVFLIYLFIRSAAPFGTGFFPSHDGMAQTFPYSYRYINQLFNGDFSTVNYSVGLGQGALGKLSLLINPFYWLIGLFSLSNISICFTLIAYLMFIMPAFTFIVYLTHRPTGKRMSKTDIRLIPFALAYSLSGYLISFMSHHGFMIVAILLPILILALEQVVYKQKAVLYVIILAYLMINDFYNAFLTCEFIFLYFFCLNFESIKDMLKKGIHVAFYSMISAGFAAFLLIPSYLNTVQKSPYHDNDASIPGFGFASDFLRILNYAKVAPPAVIIDKNSNTSVNMYCGLLLFLLVPVYLLCKKINLSERIRKVVLLVLYFISFGNPLLNYIMHGLHNQIFVPNRFAIFYIFLLITVVYDLVQNMSYKADKKQILSFYVWEVIVGILFLVSAKKILSFSTIVSLCFLAIYAVLIIICVKKSFNKTITRILALIFIIELLVSAFNYTRYTIYSNHINTELSSYNNVSIITERNHLDEGHARTEYLASEKNSALVINTESVSFFTSNVNQENQSMIGYMGADVPAIANNIGYELSNPLSDLFLNVRYHIINQYFKVDQTYTFMNKIDEINNISLYENPYNVGFGFLIKDDNALLEINDKLENGNYTYDTYIDFHDEIAMKLTGQPLYEQIEFDTDPEKINNDPNATFVMSDYSNYVEGDPDSFVTVCIGIGANLKGDFYLNYGYFTHIASKTSDKQEIIYLQMDADQYEFYLGNTFYLVRMNEDTMQKIHDILSDSVLYDVHDEGNDIVGSIDASADGIIYVSLPYKDDYKVYIDDREVEIQSLFAGIGIPVKAGSHKICIRYIHKGLKAGIVISIATLIFFIAFMMFIRMTGKRKASVSDASDDNLAEDSTSEDE